MSKLSNAFKLRFMNKSLLFGQLLAILGLFSACGDTLEPVPAPPENTLQKNQMENPHIHAPQRVKDGVHYVVLEEQLTTSKYIYLRVKEDQHQYWIAAIKQDVNLGETYFYADGLLKTNFESKEHQRVFDTIYLVSNLVPADHGQAGTPSQIATSSSENPAPPSGSAVSVKIGDLVANPSKYANQHVEITGKCVKVNSNIMGRNWIHVEDGTNNGFDLVVTSDETVSAGSNATFVGVVSLNKDFGAGYTFDVIIENGRRK